MQNLAANIESTQSNYYSNIKKMGNEQHCKHIFLEQKMMRTGNYPDLNPEKQSLEEGK